jgi:hypothetical protein
MLTFLLLSDKWMKESHIQDSYVTYLGTGAVKVTGFRLDSWSLIISRDRNFLLYTTLRLTESIALSNGYEDLFSL